MLWRGLGHQLTDTQLANARTFSAEKRSKFQEYKGFLFCIELQRTGKKITLTVETLKISSSVNYKFAYCFFYYKSAASL